MIRVNKISVQLGKKEILRDVSLNLHPGEMLAVIGANGAGKSTLLKAIAGQLKLRSGDILIHNRAIERWKAEELAQVRAVLSQHTELSFSFKVIDTVLLGRFPAQGAEQSSTSRLIADWALEQVQLSDKAERDIRSLSGGERQRVHFARILTQLYDDGERQKKFLLLDEPTASQDLAQQHHLLQLARSCAHDLGYGVLVILHDMNLAAQYANRIALLKNGQLLKVGSPEVVLTPQLIESAFQISTIVRKHPVEDCLQITAIPSQTSKNSLDDSPIPFQLTNHQ